MKGDYTVIDTDYRVECWAGRNRPYETFRPTENTEQGVQRLVDELSDYAKFWGYRLEIVRTPVLSR